MPRSIFSSLLAIALLAGPPAFAADDAYTLKLYKSKKGDKTENEKTEVSKNNVAFNVAGMDMKLDISNGKKEIYTEEILEKKDGDKKATKLTRTYATAEKTEMGETTKHVYAGETVLIEKKGDKYEFSIKGKALKDDEAPDLFKSFNKKEDEPENEDFLPMGAVKVGETWKVAAEKSEKMFKTLGDEKMKFDTKKSTIGGKLLKVYRKDGAQFGTLEITFTILVTEMDLEGTAAKAKEGSKMILKGTIDTCIDGTVQFEDGKMEVSIDITADLPNDGSLTISGTTTGIEKTRAVKK